MMQTRVVESKNENNNLKNLDVKSKLIRNIKEKEPSLKDKKTILKDKKSKQN